MAAFAAGPCGLFGRCLLWMLLAAPPAASSWAIATDESGGGGVRAVRDRGTDSKGDPPPPDEQYDRHHDSSYGTFASEFYETRFISDEGYPFPTAPPVDPFAKIRVDDCGKTKGCFRTLTDISLWNFGHKYPLNSSSLGS